MGKFIGKINWENSMGKSMADLFSIGVELMFLVDVVLRYCFLICYYNDLYHCISVIGVDT